MLSCQVIMEEMEKIAPKHLAQEWDNVGLLVGSPSLKVEKILIALDINEELIARAEEEKVGLIITHHPLIFKSMKNVRTDLPLGKMIARLIKNDIAVIAAHTNLDIAKGGVNDVLAERLGLKKIEPFVVVGKNGEEVESLGRIGSFDKNVSLDEFSIIVKSSLKAKHIRVIRSGERLIKKVALCSGSGAEFIRRAVFLGADVLVTGDVKYHDAQHAKEEGIHVIDAGHFSTEYPIVPVLAERLENELKKYKGNVEILIDTDAKDFFEVFI